MPFDPRLVHPDDAPLRPDGDLDLPDDLAALAGQLADDAAHLSACYPACWNPQVALASDLVDSAKRIKRNSWRQAGLAIGVGLTALTTIVVAVSLVLRNREPGDPERNSSSDVVVTTAAPIAPLATPISLPTPTPTTLSLGELTGPEMEALFDLLQRDSQRASSIAF